MSADLQMARGAAPGGFNLAVGEPVVLQKHLSLPRVALRGPYEYPTMEGAPALVKELKVLYPDHHVVVTNGAKQALAAAFYAYGQRADRSRVFHKAPYWPSYPTLAKFAGMAFRSGEVPTEDDVHCTTSPNNPDGAQVHGRWTDVWDAVYAHSCYGWDGGEPNHQARVGSASKLLGLSGARVGWLVTRADWLAEEARKFVEFTTSGVSVPAQIIAGRALRWVREYNPLPQYQAARDEMMANGRAFMWHLASHCSTVHGVPTDGTGMFAFFRVREISRFVAALQRAKVAVVSGDACGMGAGKGWFRMNMAHDREYTTRALEALKRELG